MRANLKAELAASLPVEVEKPRKNAISQSLIDEIKQAINILDFCEQEYGVSFRQGADGWYNANCPFPDHRDSSPSFGVNPDDGKFNCFGCNRFGNIFDLMRDMEGLNFREAVTRLSELTGIIDIDGGSAASRVLRDLRRSVEDYLNRGTQTDLPAGLSMRFFLYSVADRMRRYEQKVEQDATERVWVEEIYRQVDTLCEAADDPKSQRTAERELTRLWKNLANEMRIRYAAWQIRAAESPKEDEPEDIQTNDESAEIQQHDDYDAEDYDQEPDYDPND